MEWKLSFPLQEAVAVAALSVDLAALESRHEFRLIPAGAFRALDGRPAECASWVMTDADGARLVADASARKSDYLIDYEHQLLNAEKNGQPVVAAGWFKSLEWRPGDGLYVIGPDWTALAAQRIEDKEYRYISPVFSYDQQTGRVGKLLCAALVNLPAVDGLTDLAAFAALAAQVFLTPSEETTMDELLERVRWLLNLPITATVQEAVIELDKLKAQLLEGQTAVAAASFNLLDHLKARSEEFAALSAKVTAVPGGITPNPADFVPMGEFVKVQHALAALSGRIETDEHAKQLQAGLDDGRILPATADYWRGQPLAVLSGYLNVAKPLAALSGMQSRGKAPAAGVSAGDSEAIATAACAYQLAEAGKGNTISTVQAVAHITKQQGG